MVRLKKFKRGSTNGTRKNGIIITNWFMDLTLETPIKPMSVKIKEVNATP